MQCTCSGLEIAGPTQLNNEAQYKVGLITIWAHIHAKAQIESYNWVSLSSCMVLHQSGAKANKLEPAHLSSSAGRSELSPNIAKLILISSQLPPYINRYPIIRFRYTFHLDSLPLTLTDLSVGVLAGTPIAVESILEGVSSFDGAIWNPNFSSDL